MNLGTPLASPLGAFVRSPALAREVGDECLFRGTVAEVEVNATQALGFFEFGAVVQIIDPVPAVGFERVKIEVPTSEWENNPHRLDPIGEWIARRILPTGLTNGSTINQYRLAPGFRGGTDWRGTSAWYTDIAALKFDDPNQPQYGWTQTAIRHQAKGGQQPDAYTIEFYKHGQLGAGFTLGEEVCFTKPLTAGDMTVITKGENVADSRYFISSSDPPPPTPANCPHGFQAGNPGKSTDFLLMSSGPAGFFWEEYDLPYRYWQGLTSGIVYVPAGAGNMETVRCTGDDFIGQDITWSGGIEGDPAEWEGGLVSNNGLEYTLFRNRHVGLTPGYPDQWEQGETIRVFPYGPPA